MTSDQGYSGTIGFEKIVQKLDFGIHLSNNQPEKPDPKNDPNSKQDENTAENQESKGPKEIDALYKSLLKEFESKNKTLPLDKGEPTEETLGFPGRDY